MEETLINAINDYYKLKQKYEKQQKDYIKKIRKNEDLTVSEKRRLYKSFQSKCINCKNSGGSIFSNKDRVIKAVCGNTTDPCKLNIELNLGNYANIVNLDEDYTDKVDSIKRKIIMTKLDFLFGYITDESTAIDNFTKLRKNLAQYMEAQLLVQKRYNEVVQNEDKEKEIYLAEEKLYKEIMEIRNIYLLYQYNSKQNYITEMVEKYIHIIQPLSDKIRSLKYVRNIIEDEEETFHKDKTYILHQDEYTSMDLEQEVSGDKKSGIVKNII